MDGRIGTQSPAGLRSRSSLLVVNPRTFIALVAIVSLTGCREKAGSPGGITDPVATTPPVATPPSTPNSSASPPTEEKESADTWLVVNKGVTELGVIELRAGKRLELMVEADGDDVAELKRKLDEVGGPKGIGLDMHLPPRSGTGRGEYGTVIVKPGEILYRHALKGALEPEYGVKEVQQLIDPLPPPKLASLTVSKSGARVGTIDFASTPPKLTTHSDVPEASGMKNDLEFVQDRGELKVRFHHAQNGISTLVTARAKPGDASYAQTVALFLMVERSYRMRYAYKLEFTAGK